MVDKKGGWAQKPAYQDIGRYSEGGLAPAYKDGSFAVVDEKGSLVAYAGKACGEDAVISAQGSVTFPQTKEMQSCKDIGAGG